jgi:TRAP transporter TAXI family solute receptor
MRGLTAIRLGLLCLAVLSACTHPADPPAKHYVLRMTAATAEDARVKAAYSRLPDVSVRTVTPGGASITSLIELQRGNTDVGIALADVAYLAYTGQLDARSGPFKELRGMAMLDVTTLHLLLGAHTHISAIDQLKGRHVALGPPESSSALIAETLLTANGLSVADVRGEQLAYPKTVERLASGDFDAAFMIQIPGSEPVTQAIRDGARLLDVEGPVIEQIRQHRPFLRRTLIPKGVYPGQDKPIRTIGVPRVLICRADVDEGIVYRLLEAYFAPLPGGTPAADLERAPATPLPLHAGAARYYRQRELSR